MYTTPWCGYCVRLRRQLESEGISYREIDVAADPSHDARIIAASGGFRTVPTVDVGGELLVNPTVWEIKEAASQRT